eukprot:8786505-Pyramimonas_sp.AAC.1
MQLLRISVVASSCRRVSFGAPPFPGSCPRRRRPPSLAGWRGVSPCAWSSAAVRAVFFPGKEANPWRWKLSSGAGISVVEDRPNPA